MLTRSNRLCAAVLSGVTASLLFMGTASAQDRPVVVHAEPLEQYNSERVPYGDLNLAAATDRKTLYGRVGSAVRNVCNFDSAGVGSDYRACAGLAWADARPQIDRAISRSAELALTGTMPVSSSSITIRAR